MSPLQANQLLSFRLLDQNLKQSWICPLLAHPLAIKNLGAGCLEALL
jgi:hypothetical protein